MQTWSGVKVRRTLPLVLLTHAQVSRSLLGGDGTPRDTSEQNLFTLGVPSRTPGVGDGRGAGFLDGDGLGLGLGDGLGLGECGRVRAGGRRARRERLHDPPRDAR